MWRGFNKPRFKEENNYLLALDPDNKRRIDYFVFANKPIDQWNLDHLFFTIITCFLNFRSLVCTDEKCNLVRYFKSDIFITRYFLFHLVHFIFYISNTREPQKIINWDRFNWSLLAVCVSRHPISSISDVLDQFWSLLRYNVFVRRCSERSSTEVGVTKKARSYLTS